MILILAQCIEFNEKRKICIAYENGKKYQLNNVSDIVIRKVKVDKCLIQNIGEKRCDFLMDSDHLKRVFFIELKGGVLIKAVNQIYSTIIYLRPEFMNYRMDARIVGSRNVPMIRNIPDYLKLSKLVGATNGEIKIATNKVYSENI